MKYLAMAGAVFFGHHLVAIALQSGIFEVHVSGFYACLIEPLGRAMGVRAGDNSPLRTH